MQDNAPGRLQRFLTAFANLWESPWGSGVIAGLIYLALSGVRGPSPFPYFNYLADAFLHGSLSLRQLPEFVHDLAFFNGQYYLYWPPFPAVVLMPFVALFGLRFNDVVFTALLGGLNVGLIAALLRAACRAGFLQLNRTQRAILVLFFALGTVHFTLAPRGSVWFTSQLIGFACTILAYWAAFSLRGGRAWFLTGLALACAMLTRTPLVLTGIFPAVYLLRQEKPWDWKRVIGRMALGALPIVIGGLLYLAYNQARFGNPFDIGYAYHNMNQLFRADYEQYGAFNLHYLPTNLYYQYIFYPLPIRWESLMGGSLFLLSPLFFAAFAAFWKPRMRWGNWALLGTILVTNIPILLLMGTGWVQFGPRYTLDFTVPLLLLTALGMERWKNWFSGALVLLAIIQYFFSIFVW